MDKATAEKVEWALQYADDHNRSGISGHVNSNILADEVRRLRALTTPESHITQAAKLATMLPTSDTVDDSASEVIGRFEKGSGKSLHDTEATPSKPDQLLGAAKAVLDWYDPNSLANDRHPAKALREAIQAREKVKE